MNGVNYIADYVLKECALLYYPILAVLSHVSCAQPKHILHVTEYIALVCMQDEPFWLLRTTAGAGAGARGWRGGDRHEHGHGV